MAYTDDSRRSAAPRRRRPSEQPATNKRRRRRREFQFDLIVLAAVVLVLVVAMNTPPRVEPTSQMPTSPTTLHTQPPVTTIPTVPTVPPTTAPPMPLEFTAADESLVYVRTISWTDGDADTEDVIEALEAKLDWDLRDPNACVFIYHSHISESYTLTDDQEPNESSGFWSDPYRTDDDRYNLVAVGQRVTQILRDNGIRVIHDTTSFEKPNSDYAYDNARDYLRDVLDEHPEICLILDIHRDAVPDPNDAEKQWAPVVTVEGKRSAMISMLIGYNDNYDRIWDQNLAFAVKLGAQMNKNVPDAFRQLLINNMDTRYNQDMGPVSMLVEVGTAGNSLEEALNGADLLAQALVDMALGANVDE